MPLHGKHWAMLHGSRSGSVGCVVAVQWVLRVIGALMASLLDRLRVLWCSFGEQQALAAEILFLRRQLAVFEERGARRRQLRPAERLRDGAMSLATHWRAGRSLAFRTAASPPIRWARALAHRLGSASVVKDPHTAHQPPGLPPPPPVSGPHPNPGWSCWAPQDSSA